MKKMTIILSTILLFSAASLYARPKPKHGPFNATAASVMELNRMQKFLDLTDDQIKKIHEINKTYLDRYFEKRKDKDAMKTLIKEHKEAVDAVLTKEQLEKIKNAPFRGYDRKKKKDE